MKQHVGVFSVVTAGLASLAVAACTGGGDETTTTRAVSRYASEADRPACDSSHDLEVAFAVAEQSLTFCTDGQWVAVTAGAGGAAGAGGGTGPRGATGDAGAIGATGLDGLLGVTGLDGATGAIGATGGDGVAGATGVDGATGAAGATGPYGAAGATGVTGPSGATGVTGPNGVAGTTGAAGATGASGVTGPNGAAGVTGASGVTGLNGVAGATGATGVAGPNGVAGATGTTGVAGASGVAGATGATGVAGPSGVAGATGATGVTGASGVAGATGATGVAGPNGVAGVTGATGVTGANGVTGATGATGAAELVAISPELAGVNCANGGFKLVFYTDSNGNGSLDSVEAAAATTSYACTANSGPAGVGVTGSAGAQGSTGATGNAGAVGATGDVGATGATGDVGATGAVGSAGVNGATGATGAAGATGATGDVGATGSAGATGATGATGTYSGFVLKNACGASGTSPCALGATGPAGGIIVFVDFRSEYADFDYLEATASDFVQASGVIWAPKIQLATSNATLSGTSAAGGVTPTVGDRILLRNQTTTSENGIYTVNSGAWTPINTNQTTGCYSSTGTVGSCANGFAYDAYNNGGLSAYYVATAAMGMGKTNTDRLVAAADSQGAPRSTYLAGIAKDYSTTVNSVTYADWFLPSSQEAVAMVTTLAAFGRLDPQYSGKYLATSSEISSTQYVRMYPFLLSTTTGGKDSGAPASAADRYRFMRRFSN